MPQVFDAEGRDLGPAYAVDYSDHLRPEVLLAESRTFSGVSAKVLVWRHMRPEAAPYSLRSACGQYFSNIDFTSSGGCSSGSAFTIDAEHVPLGFACVIDYTTGSYLARSSWPPVEGVLIQRRAPVGAWPPSSCAATSFTIARAAPLEISEPSEGEHPKPPLRLAP